MTYYAYLAFHDGVAEGTRYWDRKPIAYIEFCRGRKEGPARIERLCKEHADLLPQDGWKKPMHFRLDTDDNAVVEKMKREIRLRLATKSIDRHGMRRLWADKPGAPAGCYRLDFYEANAVLRDVLEKSGLYKPG
jgi:hypothetical protein